jgi:hypothetical protein
MSSIGAIATMIFNENYVFITGSTSPTINVRAALQSYMLPDIWMK